MTLRTFLLGTFVSMISAWAIWGLIVMWLDPSAAGLIGFILFFLTLFLATASTSALIGYGVRRLLAPKQLPRHRVRPALRQGIWLGIFTNLLLFLQLQRLLQWWITVIILILITSLEYIFISYDKSTSRNRGTAQESKEQD